MDGFGLREPVADNAIAAAHTPVYDRLLKTCLHTKIDGSGQSVGLPQGQMGNSEVGHLNLGAGRILYQDISRIDKSIDDGSFFNDQTLIKAMDRVVADGSAVHLFGLVSDGQVHSSLKHLYALVELAKKKGVANVYLHAFMDGRDTPPTAGIKYLGEILQKFKEIGCGKIATIGGRYYGMDRDQRWERCEKAYRVIVCREGKTFSDPLEAVRQSYAADVTDEFIEPVLISHDGDRNSRLSDGDCALFFNFRADRARQLCQMLLGYENDGYEHPNNPQIELLTMTNYDVKMTQAKVVFQRVKPSRILGEILAEAGMKQLRTAETEKYAHVTFFFNGGTEKPFDSEDRYLVPSPKVATYDLQPEMSSVELTDNAVARITSSEYDFVLLNYANCDMVGHTGDFEAAKKAVEAVDRGLGRLLGAVKDQNGVAIVTADHGNAELMIDPETGGPWTAHTTNLVPCILYDPSGVVKGSNLQLRENGILANIAPTILDIIELDKPSEMTEDSLILRG